MNKPLILLKVFLSVVFGFFTVVSSLQADPFAWTPSSTISVEPNEPFDNVTTCYDSLHNRIFAAWVDVTTNYPTYCIYSNGTWSAPLLIDSSSTTEGLRDVFLCYDSQNDRVFAAWNDTNNDNYPTFSIYSNGAWSSPAPIDTTSYITGAEVFLCYNPTDNVVFATWPSGPNATPSYSIYSAGAWSARADIDASGFLVLNVYTCFNSQENKMIATWSDANLGMVPTYSVYSGGSWSAAATITMNGNTINTFPCYNSLTNEVFATWIDDANDGRPTYSIFNGSTWTTENVVTGLPTSSSAFTLFSCYDSIHNQIFTAWPNLPNCDPMYSIYSEGAWSPVAFINMEPPGVLQEIFLTYNLNDDEMFATWTDCVSFLPFYSIYYDTNPITPVLPPSHLLGKQLKNDFGVVKEYYNLLTWHPSLSDDVVGYLLYRDGELIATLGSNILTYQDHNRKKKKAYTYTLKAFDSVGTQSIGISFTVKGKS